MTKILYVLATPEVPGLYPLTERDEFQMSRMANYLNKRVKVEELTELNIIHDPNIRHGHVAEYIKKNVHEVKNILETDAPLQSLEQLFDSRESTGIITIHNHRDASKLAELLLTQFRYTVQPCALKPYQFGVIKTDGSYAGRHPK